ncbi:MAG: glycosyltransferase family 4 protein [Kiritimatiellae bacterium]|nr:glycosyltransferase family 4 protein [Kiritimatiellia bacterium]
MKIAFAVVKNVARGGGIERYTEELGARLVSRGHGVRVYSMRHHGRIEPDYRGMRITGVPCLPFTPTEKVSAGVAAAIHAGLSPWADVVHLHSVGPGVMGWFTRLCRKPTLIQFHGIEWKRTRWSRFGLSVLRSLERWSIRANRHVTAVSRTQCEYFRAEYGIEARYIPGGADVKEPRPAHELYSLGLEPGRYVLFASRLVREKGAHVLVEAFRRLAAPCKLVLAGDVPGEDAYRDELRRLAGDDPRIVWPGFVQGALRDELFSHARVYVQPSDVEGLSLALLEAMGRGLCCLASDIPENAEAVAEAGVLFRRGDAADLAAKLQDLLDHPDTAATYGGRAAARVRREYSWDRIADEFERYYREIILGAARHE